jgi:hypothetical protein
MRLKFALGMILMVALAFAAYSWQIQRMSAIVGASGPGGIVDAVGVKMDLLMIASAEQQQFALESKYLSLADLRAKGVAVPEKRGGYAFSADLTAGTFLIKATYKAPEGTQPPPELVIGPDMKVKELPAAAR